MSSGSTLARRLSVMAGSVYKATAYHLTPTKDLANSDNGDRCPWDKPPSCVEKNVRHCENQTYCGFLQSGMEKQTSPNTNTPDGQYPPQVRRRFPRFAVDMRVSATAFRAGVTVSFWGRTSEMGRDGIGATLTGELEPGEVVSLDLSLPHYPMGFKLRALVRYRQGLRHGFEFLTLTPEQRGTLDRVCEVLAQGE